MKIPNLDALILTEVELRAAREQVQQMAYFKWKNAGCPADGDLKYWNDAQLEWIEFYYVPHRNGDVDAPRAR